MPIDLFTCVINNYFVPAFLYWPFVTAFLSHIFLPWMTICKHLWLTTILSWPFCIGLFVTAFLAWPFCPRCFWFYFNWMPICKHVWSTLISHFFVLAGPAFVLVLLSSHFAPTFLSWPCCPWCFNCICLECLFLNICDQLLVFLHLPICHSLFVFPDVFECLFLKMCNQQLFCPGLSVLAFCHILVVPAFLSLIFWLCLPSMPVKFCKLEWSTTIYLNFSLLTFLSQPFVPDCVYLQCLLEDKKASTEKLG